MSLPKLDMLPLEVLQCISDTLEIFHRPSVASFSLVNRGCHQAAASTLFRRLKIYAESPHSLVTSLEKWTGILLANDSFRHVRQLSVRGDIYTDWQRHSHEQSPDAQGRYIPPFDGEECWLPLASFIRKLPGLTDLYFQSHGSLPVHLLALLSDTHLSKCRIHLNDFRLDSLRRNIPKGSTEQVELTPHDFATVTLPNLYSIEFTNSGSNSVIPNYTTDAVFQIVAQFCPGLKEVEFIHQRQKATPRARARRPFPGLKLDQHNPSTKAKLTSLSLGGRETRLDLWQQHTDFDNLRTLKLVNVDVAILEWASEHARFPSLSVLEAQTFDVDDQRNFSKFLQSLPMLQNLTIHGDEGEETVNTIIQHHGPRLRRLSLPDILASAALLTRIKKHCPCLEHLSITLSRTQGDANEVALYDTLSSFPCLRTLNLNLDCSINKSTPFDYVEPIDHYDEPYARQIRINCAIDSTLAASIFRRLVAGSAFLKSVELNVINTGVIMLRGSKFVRYEDQLTNSHFARRWMCGFSLRDDCEEVVAEENEVTRVIRKRCEDVLGLWDLGGVRDGFRALWAEGTSGDWRDDWSSFPLQA